MQHIEEFLSELKRLDVRLWADGEHLRCNAPKGALTPDIRDKISQHKEAILSVLRKEAPAAFLSHDPIRPAPRDGHIPPSFAQQRLWFLNRLEPGSPAYNMPAAFRLEGSLDVPALERSLTEVVRRHETLRTVFPEIDGAAVQKILPPFVVVLPVIDLQAVPGKELDAKLNGLIAEESLRPFDLSSGPLLRLSVLRIGHNSHVLLVTMHHIITDGWSIVVFIRELSTLYDALCRGRAVLLPELPIQYADYACRQQRSLQGTSFKIHLDYWKRRLAGIPPLLEMPLDHPRPALQGYQGSAIPFELDAEHTERVKCLSRNEGATLYMALLAAFAALLFRYSGQGDIVVGTPVANRNREEIEGLIGFFTNTLVLRIGLSDNLTFRELLGRARLAAVEAYEHQDVPFEKLVEELRPERHLSYNPLVQVVFVLQNVPGNAPTPSLKLHGLDISPVAFDHGTVRLDLEVHLWEMSGGLKGSFIYNTGLFDAATIAGMAGHFQTILRAISVHPDLAVAELPLLTDAERHQILVEWNTTRSALARDACIHQVFEAVAARRQDAIAAVYEGETISYHDLNARANQLARYLQARGVVPETPVIIFADRSLEMIVGMLGILKAGGAYVPLDPAYPDDRIAFMLGDCGASVLLTRRHLADRLSTLCGPESSARKYTIVCLDGDCEAISRESASNTESGATAGNLAYIIYTSGSTGRPKGVQINHGSVVHLFDALYPTFHFGGDDVWTVFHSYSFDFSVWEIWGALLYGCRLVVVPQRMAQSPKEFYRLLQTERVTVLNQTPSAMYQLFQVKGELESAEGPLSLRHIMCGGEALPDTLTKQLLAWGIPLWNFYGPTEATVWTTVCRVDPVDLLGKSVPIGRPIPDARVYLLDSHRQPVPIGVPGELFIGGAGLARGYLNRQELNAEKFVPDPFQEAAKAENGSDSGGRLYRTGDLARYRRDGTIEFIGRADHQVKLRGFRIELGEIESVLATHPAVRESAVIMKEYDQGDKRLIACVVPREGQTITTEALRRHLKEALPEYMVPSTIVVVEKMVLSPNGKVDRKAIALLDKAEMLPGKASEAPGNEVERKIAAVWQEALHREKVGVHDNFFETGGHSLLTVKVHSKLREVLGADISIIDLFQYPTISALAEFITRSKGREQPVLPETDDRARKQKDAINRQKEMMKQMRERGK